MKSYIKASFAMVVVMCAGVAHAETRVSYGSGISFCDGTFAACDEAFVVRLGVEQATTERTSIELEYSSGGMFGSGSFDSFALHAKRTLQSGERSFFIAAGAHYYDIEDHQAFAERVSTSGIGFSSKFGWQMYRQSGFGVDVAAFARTFDSSDLATGVTISLSYGF